VKVTGGGRLLDPLAGARCAITGIVFEIRIGDEMIVARLVRILRRHVGIDPPRAWIKKTTEQLAEKMTEEIVFIVTGIRIAAAVAR
jgi:hypothetical protein